mmetsp:Transcript_84107/g.236365  ORF Transcript_84107/g.236365 Transcript_84107/m.236365 type:complete len:332 (+) Transcript_84107:314-1309(+)
MGRVVQHGEVRGHYGAFAHSLTDEVEAWQVFDDAQKRRVHDGASLWILVTLVAKRRVEAYGGELRSNHKHERGLVRPVAAVGRALHGVEDHVEGLDLEIPNRHQVLSVHGASVDNDVLGGRAVVALGEFEERVSEKLLDLQSHRLGLHALRKHGSHGVVFRRRGVQGGGETHALLTVETRVDVDAHNHRRVEKQRLQSHVVQRNVPQWPGELGVDLQHNAAEHRGYILPLPDCLALHHLRDDRECDSGVLLEQSVHLGRILRRSQQQHHLRRGRDVLLQDIRQICALIRADDALRVTNVHFEGNLRDVTKRAEPNVEHRNVRLGVDEQPVV